MTRVREESRDRWSVPWLDHLQQDVRYALRGLRRSPGFALSAIVTLGLGIGANAAMFGVIDRLMLRPHAYLRDAGRVHRVYLQYKERTGRSRVSPSSTRAISTSDGGRRPSPPLRPTRTARRRSVPERRRGSARLPR